MSLSLVIFLRGSPLFFFFYLCLDHSFPHSHILSHCHIVSFCLASFVLSRQAHESGSPGHSLSHRNPRWSVLILFFVRVFSIGVFFFLLIGISSCPSSFFLFLFLFLSFFALCLDSLYISGYRRLSLSLSLSLSLFLFLFLFLTPSLTLSVFLSLFLSVSFYFSFSFYLSLLSIFVRLFPRICLSFPVCVSSPCLYLILCRRLCLTFKIAELAVQICLRCKQSTPHVHFSKKTKKCDACLATLANARLGTTKIWSKSSDQDH
jgi:hypothetical protein